MKFRKTANRLNEALSDAGLSPQDLVNITGINKASISQYRNGTHKPSNKTAAMMAPVLNVNPLWLMGFDVGKNEPSLYRKLTDYSFIYNYIQTADEKTLGEIRRYIEYVIENGR